MCGIVGFSTGWDEQILTRMSQAIHHRGPDDVGHFLDNATGVGLAARRLAVLDIPGGHQPMSDATGRYHLVFNGEIYNAAALRTELLKEGYPLRTSHSDTECLLYLYLAHGPAMLDRLNGMFAFVIYDRVEVTLFAARDRMGIKPFYYRWKDGQLAFASELKALLECPGVSRAINSASLYHYASLNFVPGPDSIFKEIQKLPAGHSLHLNLKSRRLDLRRYWELNTKMTQDLSAQEWQHRLSYELGQAVTRWSRSDAPVGCSLSGGVDSAGVVGLLAESGMSDLRTYSVGFSDTSDQDCDERALARQVADRWGTRHQEILIDSRRVADDLDDMVWHLDEPYGGGLPSWYVYQAMSKEVKVALTGMGADELFGSYGKYKIYEGSRSSRLAWRLRQTKKFGTTDYLHPHRHDLHGLFFRQYLSDAFKQQVLFELPMGAETGTAELMEKHWQALGATNPKDAVASLEFRYQLPDEFLHVTDRLSMAHSVEARTPYLDHQFVESVFSMPAGLRVGNGVYKETLHQLLGDRVPTDILKAPKRGFILPLRDWTGGPLKERILDTLSPERLHQQGIFSQRINRRLVRPHMTGMRDFTRQIWSLFMFQLWYDQYV